MAKSPEEMGAAMVKNLQEKTGKTMPQWLKIVAKSKLSKHGEIVKHLQPERGVTHGFANLIAHNALRVGQGDAPTKTIADALKTYLTIAQLPSLPA